MVSSPALHPSRRLARGSPLLLNQARRLTRSHYAILALAWSTWLFGFFSLMLFSAVAEPVKRELAASDLQMGRLLGVAIGATGLGGFLFGWLADRAGRRASIGIAAVTFALGNAACALAPDLDTLVWARALAGLGIGGSWGAGQALIGETFPAERRGRFGAIAQSGAPLGLGLAAVVGAWVVPATGWRAAFALAALPVAIVLLLALAPESDVWRAHPRTGSVARELVRGETGSLFVRCFVLTLLNMSNYWFAVTWLPSYLQRERGLSEARSGLATLVFVLGSLTGYLSFGLLSDRWGRRRSFSLYCGVMTVGLLGFTALWPLVGGGAALFLAFLFVAGLGTGTWSSYGPMFSEVFPTRVRGTALAVIMNLSRGVQFLAPLVIAAVAPRWGLGGGIALAAGFSALAGLWIWTLPETRGRPITAGEPALPARA